MPVQKRYVVDGQSYYYRNAGQPGAPIKDLVQVFYQFKNEERGGLGMPMPAGTVRVYQEDSKGGVQFVGEDRIDHTPKDEVLNLKIGNAFDVVCERKQIDFEKIASNVYEMEYEITLRNHKTVPVVGGSERTDRRHLADGAQLARVHEDGGLGGAVQRAGGGGRHGGAEVPGESDVLTTGQFKVQEFKVQGAPESPGRLSADAHRLGPGHRTIRLEHLRAHVAFVALENVGALRRRHFLQHATAATDELNTILAGSRRLHHHPQAIRAGVNRVEDDPGGRVKLAALQRVDQRARLERRASHVDPPVTGRRCGRIPRAA